MHPLNVRYRPRVGQLVDLRDYLVGESRILEMHIAFVQVIWLIVVLTVTFDAMPAARNCLAVTRCMLVPTVSRPRWFRRVLLSLRLRVGNKLQLSIDALRQVALHAESKSTPFRQRHCHWFTCFILLLLLFWLSSFAVV